MKFGLNTNINYYGVPKNQPKKVHQETPTHHLETLDGKKPQQEVKGKEKDNTPTKVSNQKTDNHNNELMTILTVTGISAYLITKYII